MGRLQASLIPFMNDLIINNIHWKIKPVIGAAKALVRGDGTTTIGMTDFNDRTIYLNKNLNGQLLYNVLCHEIVHAFCFSYGFYIDEWEEERLANFIADYGEDIIYHTDEILRDLCFGRYGYEMC